MKEKAKKLRHWILVHIYTILYIALLVVLSIYIVRNWDNCISMQFFSNFDGNNILFLVWIALIVLPFYVIEGKGIKLKMRSVNEATERIQDAGLKYEVERRTLISAEAGKAENQEGGDEV